MERGRRGLGAALLGGLLAGVGPVEPACSEIVLSAYGGIAGTLPSDVELSAPGRTDLTARGVSWTDESFTSPPYYGVRVGYWFGRRSSWGLALDFTHAKAIARLDREVRVSGRRASTPVDAREPLSDTFSGLEFSHGHNILTLNGLSRWLPMGERDRTLLGRLQLYAGAGAGAAIPHVETRVDGTDTFEYQLGGPTLQGLVGLNVDLIRYVSIFTEYKISYSWIDADLTGGGRLKTDLLTNHFAFGLTLSFP